MRPGRVIVILALLAWPAAAQLDERAAWLASPEYRLSIAVRDGHLAAAQELIAKGAEVNARSPGSGQTALMMAASQGYLEILDALLAAGADPLVEVGAGDGALTYGAMNGRLPVVARLLSLDQAPNQSAKDRALRRAARFGHPKTAMALVEAGAALERGDGFGLTPLMLAAKHGHPLTTRRLLDLGATVEARDREGRGALFWAVWTGHLLAAEVLLLAGADPEARDQAGLRALGQAADFEALIAARPDHAAHQSPRPALCRRAIANGYLSRQSGALVVTAWSLPTRPEPGTKAWVLTAEGAAAFAAAVTGSRPSETQDDAWDATLGVADEPAGLPENLDAASPDLWVILPPGPSAPRKLSLQPDALPPGVFPRTVVQAFDLEGGGAADGLEVRHCCGDASRREACDYSCGATWQKRDGRWLKCSAWTPA